MKAIENAPEDVKQAMLKIVDCVACSDGGISFANLIILINVISDQLNEPSQKDSSKKLLDIIVQFSRIIDHAQKVQQNGPSKIQCR